MTDLHPVWHAIEKHRTLSEEAAAELRADIAKRKAELMERDQELDWDLGARRGDPTAPRGLSVWPMSCGCKWVIDEERWLKECQKHQEAQEVLIEGDV